MNVRRAADTFRVNLKYILEFVALFLFSSLLYQYEARGFETEKNPKQRGIQLSDHFHANSV